MAQHTSAMNAAGSCAFLLRAGDSMSEWQPARIFNFHEGPNPQNDPSGSLVQVRRGNITREEMLLARRLRRCDGEILEVRWPSGEITISCEHEMPD